MSAIVISDIRLHAPSHGSWRVSANVDGAELWLESSDQLSVCAETFVAAGFFPAAFSGRPIELHGDLDPMFAQNLVEAGEVTRDWWGVFGPSIVHHGLSTPRSQSTRKSALFFTGGVDSFYSLQRKLPQIDFLINVRGFDIELDDDDRLQAASRLLRSVAGDASLRLVEVTTNMRSHPLFTTVNWEITHLAAIAAVGHAMSDQISTAYVASSDVPPPWGSNERLDHLWSGSRLEIVNDGWGTRRLQKVAALVHWRLARDNVKVCWENRSKALNCGACEKCVRTQAMFLCEGAETPLQSFPAGDIVERIERLGPVQGELLNQWKDVSRKTDGVLRAAILKLIDRSENKAPDHPPPPEAMVA